MGFLDGFFSVFVVFFCFSFNLATKIIYKANFQPVVVRDEKMYDQSHHDIIKNVMERLEEYVKPTGFVANSKEMTVADLAVLANYTTLKECDLLPEESYPYVDAWEKGCKNLVKNYEKTNGKGAEALGVRFKEALNKIGK